MTTKPEKNKRSIEKYKKSKTKSKSSSSSSVSPILIIILSTVGGVAVFIILVYYFVKLSEFVSRNRSTNTSNNDN